MPNSSERHGPTTADIDALRLLFRHPGWKHFQRYLRVLRRNAAHSLLYRWDPQKHQTEIARDQAEIRLIDRILADGDDASKVLAHRIYDNLDTPAGAPYRADDATEKTL